MEKNSTDIFGIADIKKKGKKNVHKAFNKYVLY